MTPHQKAFEAAILQLGEHDEFGHWSLDWGNLNHFIAKYLTTMLDSPEMVEGTVRAIEQADYDFNAGSRLPVARRREKISRYAKAVIAAIKKEAGV